MATKIRLARGGSKKRPFYSIVVTDSRMPRDGRFLEKLGTYNPMLAKDDANRVVMNVERAKELLATGAQPTDRVARFLEAAGVLAKKVRSNPKTGTPGKAMAERAAKKAARNEARDLVAHLPFNHATPDLARHFPLIAERVSKIGESLHME